MFYADFVLSKKGPLARIWLAAHWDRKITKSQVFETNIEKSVDGILQPSIKMALRTSGHLLLGVVRIYSRKAKYLLADCNEAFVKIKMAFRPGVVDLPEDHRETAVSAVTLPEVFHDFDNAIPDFKYMWGDMDIEVQFSVNQSRVDEITMREDNANTHLGNEYRFDDSSFDAGNSDILRESAQFNQSLNQANLLLAENIGDLMQANGTTESTSFENREEEEEEDDNRINDDFHGTLEVADGGLFQGGLFDDTPMPDVPLLENDTFDSNHRHDEQMELEHAVHSVSKASPRPEVDAQIATATSPDANAIVDDVNRENDDYDDDDHFIPPSPGAASSDDSRPPTPIIATVENDNQDKVLPEFEDKAPTPTHVLEESRPWSSPPRAVEADDFAQPAEELAEEAPNVENINDNVDQSTIVHNEEGTFALLPVDASAVRGMSKPKRKRKLIVDEVKNISGDEMKGQLNDTGDIVTSLDLAPPTKRLMHWKETGGVEKLFALPGKNIPARHLFKNYQRFLTSRTAAKEDGQRNDQIEAEHIKENIPPVDLNGDNVVLADQRESEQVVSQSRRGRKRKVQPEEEEQSTKDKEDDEAPPAKRNSSVLQTNALSPHNAQNKDARILPTVEEVFNAEDSVAQIQPAAVQEESNVVERSEHDLEQPQPMDITENEIPPAEEHVAASVVNESIVSPLHADAAEVVLPPSEPQPMVIDSENVVPVVMDSDNVESEVAENETGITVDSKNARSAVVDNKDAEPIVGDVPNNDDKPTEDQVENNENNVEQYTERSSKEPNVQPVVEQNGDSSEINEQPVDEHAKEPQDENEVLPPFFPPPPTLFTEQIPEQQTSPQHHQNIDNAENLGYDLQNHTGEVENGYCDDGFGFNYIPQAGGGGGSTPWHDDYECPLSVLQGIEQIDNETTEEFEERVLNKRANNLYHSIRAVLSEQSCTTFSDLVKRNNRKQVAQKFYSLLVLKKFKVLELDQDEPYGEITLKPGPDFNDPKL